MKLLSVSAALLTLFTLSYTVLGSPRVSSTAIARFNARGIQGYITFTDQGNGSVRIVANLQGLRGMHNWHVHHFPVDQSLSPAVQCRGVQIGGHYDPFGRNNDSNYDARCAADQNMCEVGDLEGKFGPLPPDGQVDVVDDTGELNLSGRYSIIGRPINIHDNVDSTVHLACSTIRLLNQKEVTLLQATFVNPVAGTIYMRQVGSRDVEIFGKLFWVNDSDSTENHNWHIHQRQPGEEYHLGDCDISNEGNVGPHYDPTGNGPTSRPGYSTDCTPDTPSGCEIGDLTGKHARINIPARPDPYRNGAFFFSDSALNLSEVFGRSIVVHVPNAGAPALACAPLVQSHNFTVVAAGTGFLKASQTSPFEDTLINGYSQMGDIRALPTKDLALLSPVFGSQSTLCLKEDLYSPYDLYDGDGVTTPDRFELGDWMSRYSDELEPFASISVFDMPIYGANSIAGRTMRSVVGSSRICSAWIPPLHPANLIRAKASFSSSDSGPIDGAIYFVQHVLDNGVHGHTLIMMDIHYSDMDLDTTGHDWHVYVNPTDDSLTCEESIGDHYNPYPVSTSTLGALEEGDRSMFSDYSQDCSPTYPLRCESGDLAGKHGQIQITSDGPDRPTYSFFDPDLQLDGPFSIIGRSIGIHNVSGPLFDCVTITPWILSPTPLFVRFKAGDFLRSEFALELTEGTDVDPTDILVVLQVVAPLKPGLDVECANVRVRILGETDEKANSNYEVIVSSGNLEKFRCIDEDEFQLKFINKSPRVEGNTITADIEANRPIQSMSCALTGLPYQNCTSGTVTFSNVPFRNAFNRPYILRAVAISSEGLRTVIRRPVRIERDEFCGVHFINDGVTVAGTTAFAEFATVGEMGSFMCSMDKQVLKPCMSPQIFLNLTAGEHRLKIVPSQADCGRDNRHRVSKTFTVL